MNRNPLAWLILIYLLIFCAGCQGGQSESELAARVAQTVFAGQTQAAAGGADDALSTPTLGPTDTATPLPPSATPTPSPTITLTPTPTELPYALERTALPRSLMALVTENVTGLARLARWGNGSAYDFSPSQDGKTLAVASEQGVHLFEAQTLSQIRFFRLPGVVAVALSPDGMSVAGLQAAESGELQGFVLDVQSGQRYQLEIDDWLQPETLQFNPDGKTLSGIGINPVSFQTWELETNGTAYLSESNHLADDSPFQPAISADGSHMAAILLGNGLTVWDRQGQTVFFQAATDIIGTALSADGSLVAAATDNRELIVWQVVDGMELARLTEEKEYMLFNLWFMPNGVDILYISHENKLMRWNWQDDRLETLLEGFSPEQVKVSVDGNRMWLQDQGALSTWEIGSDQPPVALADFQGQVSGLSFNRDSTELMILHANGMAESRLLQDGSPSWSGEVASGIENLRLSFPGELVAYWGDDESGASSSVVHFIQLPGGAVTSIDLEALRSPYSDIVYFSPDGSLLAIAPEFGNIHLWDVKTGQPSASLLGGSFMSSYGYARVAISPDNEWLAVIDREGNAWLWHIPTGGLSREFSLGSGGVRDALFTLDASRLVVAVDKTIKVWGLNENKLSDSFSLAASRMPGKAGEDYDPEPRSMALSQDGDMLFVLYRQYLTAWSLQGNLLGYYELGYTDTWGGITALFWAYRGVTSLNLSPDGKLLAWATITGVIEVWGVDTR